MKKSTSKIGKGLLCAAVLCGAGLFQMPHVSYAEETFTLDEVVVTATRTPVKEFEANANITVITRKDIDNNHYHDLSEALREVPGVYIANFGGGVGYEQSNSLKINGSSKIVILVDGVRVNVAGQTFQASALNSLDNIERIEILKGSASALYGSDAKGGVINIITRRVEGCNTTLTLAGGSDHAENYSFANQGTSGGYSWIVTSKKDILGNYQDAHGLEIPQHWNGDTNTIKITKTINQASDITLNYNQYKANGFYTGTNLAHDIKTHFTNDNYDWKMIYNYNFSGHSKNQLSVVNNVFNEDYGWGPTYVKTIGIQDQFTQKIGNKHLLTSGFDFNKDKVRTTNYQVNLINRACYLQDEWAMNQQWKLTTGVRSDWHTGYDNRTTPRILLGFKQNDQTNYYVAYNEFFIAPTPYELYSNIYGNNTLKPEEGKSVEAGVSHRINHTLTASLHVFKRKANNAVGYIWPTYINYDENAHGWDIQFDKRFSAHLTGNIGYTHIIIDPTSVQTQNLDGYIPKGTWDIGLNYQQKKYNAELHGRIVLDRPGPQTATPAFPCSSYSVWDMGVNYQVTKTAKMFVKVNNMFNQYYAEMSNVAWGQPGEWYLSPGRNYRVGLQYQF